MLWKVLALLIFTVIAFFILSGEDSEVSTLDNQVESELLTEEAVDSQPINNESLSPSNTALQLGESNLEDKPKEDNKAGRALSEEELEELEDYYDRVENEWSETLTALFISEFRLDKIAIEKYEDLRDSLEEEKLVAFQEYHEKMVAIHGDNYSYRPSAGDRFLGPEVMKKYNEKVKKLMGEENFQRYIETRERFNERIKFEQDPSKGLLLIDL